MMINDEKAEKDNSWRYLLVENINQNRDELNEHKKQYNTDIKHIFDRMEKMRKELLTEIKEGRKETIELRKEVTDICNSHNVQNIQNESQIQAQIQKLQTNIEILAKDTAKQAGSDAGKESAESVSKKYSQIVLGICAAMIIVYEWLSKMKII